MGMTIHRQILMTMLIGYRNKSIPIVYLNCSPELKLRTLLISLNWRHFGVLVIALNLVSTMVITVRSFAVIMKR